MIYAINKTDVHHIDDTWSLDILDLKDYGPEKNRRYRYVLVVIDNFSKFCWTVTIKNKNAQRIKNCYENTLIASYNYRFVKKTILKDIVLIPP